MYYTVTAKSWHNYNDLPPDVVVEAVVSVKREQDDALARMTGMLTLDKHLRRTSKLYRTAVNRVQDIRLSTAEEIA